jgi:hypothetical protein
VACLSGTGWKCVKGVMFGVQKIRGTALSSIIRGGPLFRPQVAARYIAVRGLSVLKCLFALRDKYGS